MWRYGKLKGKFSDGEMNDRFTDMGFSQGHQSCGGRDSKEAKSKSFLHFAFQPFQVFGSRLFASSFFGIFASRKVAEWSRRWTLQSGCRHRCGFDMNDRFTDMGFSQGHQSCGGSPIFQSGKSAKPWAREGALKPRLHFPLSAIVFEILISQKLQFDPYVDLCS
jgi:Fe2+ transport system protein FeoA